jgi:hypothetical protein
MSHSPGTSGPTYYRTANDHGDHSHEHACQRSRNPAECIPETNGKICDSNQDQEPTKDCGAPAEAVGHLNSLSLVLCGYEPSAAYLRRAIRW